MYLHLAILLSEGKISILLAIFSVMETTGRLRKQFYTGCVSCQEQKKDFEWFFEQEFHAYFVIIPYNLT